MRNEISTAISGIHWILPFKGFIFVNRGTHRHTHTHTNTEGNSCRKSVQHCHLQRHTAISCRSITLTHWGCLILDSVLEPAQVRNKFPWCITVDHYYILLNFDILWDVRLWNIHWTWRNINNLEILGLISDILFHFTFKYNKSLLYLTQTLLLQPLLLYSVRQNPLLGPLQVILGNALSSIMFKIVFIVLLWEEMMMTHEWRL